MLEGSRAFDITWGAATGTLCLVIAVVVLQRMLRPGPSIFGVAVDPSRHLQLAYGLAAMGMAFTNYGCRFIAHRYLLGVHEGFAAITAVLVAVIVPHAVATLAPRRARATVRVRTR